MGWKSTNEKSRSKVSIRYGINTVTVPGTTTVKTKDLTIRRISSLSYLNWSSRALTPFALTRLRAGHRIPQSAVPSCLHSSAQAGSPSVSRRVIAESVQV